MEEPCFSLYAENVANIKTRVIPCLICGKSEYRKVNLFTFNDQLFHTVECSVDHFMWLQPQPGQAFYDELYKNVYHAISDPELLEQLTLDTGSDTGRRERDAALRLDEIEIYERPGSILEIGCEGGIVLSEARRRGWDVQGVELSEYYRKTAERLSIPVVYGDFLHLPIHQKFDVVALYSVLEHLTDPISYLKKIRTVLKQGGILIVRVPDTPKTGPTLALMSHVYHFNPETITLFLKQQGFSIENIARNAGTYRSERYNAELTSMNIVARLGI